MLLCDVCNAGCHASCMWLPLEAVGDVWLCSSCWKASGDGRNLQWRPGSGGQERRPSAARQAQRAAEPQPAAAVEPAAEQRQQPQRLLAATEPQAVDSRTERLLLEVGLRSESRRAAVPVARWAPRHLAGCEGRLDQWLQGRLAASSHATLASQRSQFEQFVGLAAMPAAQQPGQLARQLACWVMGRAQNGYKLSTIELGVHAVVQAAGARGCAWAAAAGVEARMARWR